MRLDLSISHFFDAIAVVIEIVAVITIAAGLGYALIQYAAASQSRRFGIPGIASFGR